MAKLAMLKAQAKIYDSSNVPIEKRFPAMSALYRDYDWPNSNPSFVCVFGILW